MFPKARPRSLRYGLAVLSVAVIAALKWLVLDPITGAALSCQFFLLAVMVAAWYGGMGPGWLATGLSALVCALVLQMPGGADSNDVSTVVVRLGMFLGEGTLIGWGLGRLQAERDRVAQANEALRLSEERFRGAFDAASIGMALVAPDGRFLQVNQALEEILGRSEAELLNLTAQEITHPDDRDAELGQVRNLLSGTDRSTLLEMRCWHQSGRIVWVRLGVSLVHDENGQPLHFVAQMEDVTEWKRSVAELAEARRVAEAASLAKDRFLALLSHELRTPLSPLLLETTALLDDPLCDPGQRPMLEMIRENIELEVRLIDDLLDLTRVAHGKLTYQFQIVDLHNLIRRTACICRGELSAKELRLQLDLTASQHHVKADPTRLQQVFWNLIKNAVKFTPSGGTITIRTRDGIDGQLVAEVADTGIGISTEALNRIFQPFEQADEGITHRFGGLGLGLAISRSIVETHGGSLTAASPGEDQGSTLTLSLATVANAPADSATEPVPTGPSELRVLLVEDNELTVGVMARFLRRKGYEVCTAFSFAEAMAAIDSDPDLDVVVSDIELGDGSGLDLMRHLRSQSAIPGIAISGYATQDDIHRSHQAGFSLHLAKPVTFSALEAALRQVAPEAVG